MNNPLLFNADFQRGKNTQKPGPRNLNAQRRTTSKQLQSLINNLYEVKAYYASREKFIDDVLIDVCYNDCIAKSGRIQEVLKNGCECNDTIVGARFSNAEPGHENHIITHYVKMFAIDETIRKLSCSVSFLDKELQGEANHSNFSSENDGINYSNYSLSKTMLRNVIIDCSAIEKFSVPNAGISEERDYMIITFYSTELNISDFVHKIGIDPEKRTFQYVGKNTYSVDRATYQIFMEKTPYLISMVATDISKIVLQDSDLSTDNKQLSIEPPRNEPIIGVIDTLFEKNVYFSKWVDYRDTINDIERPAISDAFYAHGTSVSSLIVDGPTLNPWLDDGCGHFRVRHFGVCLEKITPSSLITKIKTIVSSNRDIHVWNLSLGTDEEISNNFISFDAAELDKIQKDNDVIFIVAGTNDTRNEKKDTLRVGSPADSLNSIVVNSVRKDGTPASYSRRGKILSFFNKPDVAYYGGDYEEDERIRVFTNKGIDCQCGTSFAAPWISRKMCYLMDIMGLSKEVAKAFILDSAAGWEYKQGAFKNEVLTGYGVVPKQISNVLNCDDSEIRIVLKGTARSYRTGYYSIPLPKDDGNKTSYIARAMLCYFPECNRLQGVDYTQRELSLKFGRVTNKETIEDINENTQDQKGSFFSERDARSDFRKWENTKFISSLQKDTGLRSKILYSSGCWGFSVTSKERRKNASQDPLNFGIVVTVRNIKGQNRISEFLNSCSLERYNVKPLDISNQNRIYDQAQEELHLD
jgi:hypothetical protein